MTMAVASPQNPQRDTITSNEYRTNSKLTDAHTGEISLEHLKKLGSQMSSVQFRAPKKKIWGTTLFLNIVNIFRKVFNRGECTQHYIKFPKKNALAGKDSTLLTTINNHIQNMNAQSSEADWNCLNQYIQQLQAALNTKGIKTYGSKGAECLNQMRQDVAELQRLVETGREHLNNPQTPEVRIATANEAIIDTAPSPPLVRQQEHLPERSTSETILNQNRHDISNQLDVSQQLGHQAVVENRASNASREKSYVEFERETSDSVRASLESVSDTEEQLLARVIADNLETNLATNANREKSYVELERETREAVRASLESVSDTEQQLIDRVMADATNANRLKSEDELDAETSEAMRLSLMGEEAATGIQIDAQNLRITQQGNDNRSINHDTSTQPNESPAVQLGITIDALRKALSSVENSRLPEGQQIASSSSPQPATSETVAGVNMPETEGQKLLNLALAQSKQQIEVDARLRKAAQERDDAQLAEALQQSAASVSVISSDHKRLTTEEAATLGLHYEPQEEHSCARHALNAFFGKSQYEDRDLLREEQPLGDIPEKITADGIGVKAMYGLLAKGGISSELAYVKIATDRQEPNQTLNDIESQVDRFICAIPISAASSTTNHWVTFQKKNDEWYYINSLENSIIQISPQDFTAEYFVEGMSRMAVIVYPKFTK